MKHLSKVTLIKWATQINYPPTCVVTGTGRDTVSAQQSEKKKKVKNMTEQSSMKPELLLYPAYKLSHCCLTY